MKSDYIPAPIDVSDIQLPSELCELAEIIAKNVHEVWAAGRLAEGWKYGPERNDALRTHPGLVPYEELSETEKDYDRRTAMGTLKLIQKIGFGIKKEGVQKVFGTLDLFVSLLETEIKYPILQGGILPFWTPSFLLLFYLFQKVIQNTLSLLFLFHNNNSPSRQNRQGKFFIFTQSHFPGINITFQVVIIKGHPIAFGKHRKLYFQLQRFFLGIHPGDIPFIPMSASQNTIFPRITVDKYSLIPGNRYLFQKLQANLGSIGQIIRG